MKKTAVILFNLGGPDNLKAVRPFLFNLFNDPAIIALPNPFRWVLAQIISRKRVKEATKIYQSLGGKSPLLEQTQAQSAALEKELNTEKSNSYKIFTVMRYWHPRAETVFKEVCAYEPDEVVLLPLYPQYSTTTSASSFKEWQALSRGKFPTRVICCYPESEGFVATIAKEIDKALQNKNSKEKTRILFTAHGLPQKVIDAGDPYQQQINKTVAAIKKNMTQMQGVESVTCYQSRVGPLEWIKPYTDDEIKKAGKEGVSLIVVPIAFVSEHSETLVELDIEYKELAESWGVPSYQRIKTVQDDPGFIQGLKKAVQSPGMLCNGCDQNNKCCFKNTLAQSKFFSTLT